jgi:O-antigen/teichoic acid export membrane protein
MNVTGIPISRESAKTGSKSSSLNKERHLKKYAEIFKGSTIAFTGTLAGYGLNYLFKLISGRYLGPSGFGVLAVGISIMTVFANLSVVGLNEGITRFIPFYKTKEDYRRLKSMITFGNQVSLIIGCIITLVIFLNANWISSHIFGNSQTQNQIKLFSLLIPIYAFFIFLTGVMRGLKEMAAIAIARNLLMWGVNILVALAIAFLGLPVAYFALSFLLALIVSIFYFIKKIKQDPFYLQLKKVTPVKGARKELIIYSLPLTLTNIFYVLRDRTDILIIAAFLSSGEVGLYYAAYPFAMILTIVLYSINRIINPIVSEALAEGDTPTTKKIFKDFAVLSFQATLPLFLFVFFFAEKIIVFAYGNSYIDAATLLRILSVGYFFNVITGPFGEFLRAFNKTKFVFYISALGGISNIAMMIWLIPRYGITGAAYAALSSLILMVLLGLCFCQWVLNINPFNLAYLKTTVIGVSYFALLLLSEKLMDFPFFAVSFFAMLIIYVLLLVYVLKIVNLRWRLLNG